MNFAAKILDRQMGHNPISTGTAHPLTSPTETMRAIVWHGKHDVRCEVVPKPVISEPQDVIVKVTSNTVCGSDLHMYDSELPGMESGDILGHECMGVIVSKGDDVKWEIGTRVVVSAVIACGSCEYCERGEFTSCDTTNPSRVTEKLYGKALSGVFGYGHLLGGYWGCQAEYVRVPFANLNCLPVPDELPDEKVLYLSDVICTSYHACELGKVKKGDVVAIWGLGPIGLATVRWCQVLGCSKIIAIDNTDYRLDLARKMGAMVINFNESEPVKTIMELTGHRGVDVSIEAAGFRFAKGLLHKVERLLMMEMDTPEIITECCLATRKCGHVSIVGDYAGTCNNFPIGIIQMKHLYLASGQVELQRIWKMALEKIQSGEYDPSFLITHRMRLEDIPEVYKMMNNHEGGMIKAFVQP